MKITIIFERFLKLQVFTTEKNLVNTSTKTKTIVERAFQILILMNIHELLEIKGNFQRPSSSDSPLIF